jgi:hypothetical protein
MEVEVVRKIEVGSRYNYRTGLEDRGKHMNGRLIYATLYYVLSNAAWCIISTSKSIRMHKWTCISLVQAEGHNRKCA